MKNESSLQEYLNEFNSLLSKLIAIDMKIDDVEKIFILFCLMNDSWDGLIMNFGNTKNLTMELAVSKLLSEESQKIRYGFFS